MVLNTPGKLALFRQRFSGLTYVYGTYDLWTGRAYQVKRPVTDEVLLGHLSGRQPYGVYLLCGEQTRAAVVDIDRPEPGPVLEFLGQARHYGLPVCVERSKSKGWHLWLFADSSGVPAWKARLVIRAVLGDIEQPNLEVFPKRDRLTEEASYGSFIHAPLFGRLVPLGRTVFVDPARNLEPCPDQWQILQDAGLLTESLLDEIIEINDLQPPEQLSRGVPLPPNRLSGRTWGLPPCARRILAEGVVDNQRVACFWLAVQLKKAGIPKDIALMALTAWAQKNRPRDGRRIITAAEVAYQTHYAYAKGYRGCGCGSPAVQPFCDGSCPLAAGHPRTSTGLNANWADH
ncbi:MAG TPA: hypothetical protein PKY77_26180 [Phycisphaerae bacterium]|nr:hypothetical protein [Phycisphaerae bacterium]HRY67695.1 hypothetical protein [Phycisphaerae bacterium]HSA25146.1 hypothetical protein [Phycisphaerae bacterium]